MNFFPYRSSLILAALGALAGCSSSGGSHGAAPAGFVPTPDPVVRAEALAVGDTWMAEEAPESLGWDWGDGVLAFGMLELAAATGEGRFQDYVRAYVDRWEAGGIIYFWNDNLTPALSAGELLLREGGDYPDAFDGALQYVYEDGPRTPSGGLRHLGFLPIDFIADLWVDSLFHFVPLLVRDWRLRGNARALDEAADQILLFAEHMQDPATDLFTHAWRDAADVQVPTFEEAAFWARGNSWVIAAMVDLLAALPATHPDYDAVLDRARRLEAALRAAQSADGRYHTLLLDDSTYLETAGSGLITYGMARGVREGIFGMETWEAARRGMDGLRNALIVDEEAGTTEVGMTSRGTIPIAILYPTVPTDKQVTYGVGAWLLAATEFFRDWRPSGE